MAYEIKKERKELFLETLRFTRQAVDVMTGSGVKGKDDDGRERMTNLVQRNFVYETDGSSCNFSGHCCFFCIQKRYSY
jgi:hypothetical protein